MSTTAFQIAFTEVEKRFAQHEKLWWSPEGMRTDAVVDAWQAWTQGGNSIELISISDIERVVEEVLVLSKRAYARLRKAHQRSSSRPTRLEKMAPLDAELLERHEAKSDDDQPIVGVIREFLESVDLSVEERRLANRILGYSDVDSLTQYEGRKARMGLRSKLDRYLKSEGLR